MPELLNRHLQKALIKAKVCCSPLPLCPDISLYLFDPTVLEGPLTPEEAQAVVAQPAYWSFCWASGQVLAAHVLDHPELVIHKTVIDFGSGSGVVAIAAAKAGAKKVYALDIDPDALDAVRENARLNEVQIETLNNFPTSPRHETIDVILAADVLYDKDNHPLLSWFRKQAALVILADSRVKQLPDAHYHYFSCLEARTWPDLNEFEEFNQVRLYRATYGQKP